MTKADIKKDKNKASLLTETKKISKNEINKSSKKNEEKGKVKKEETKKKKQKKTSKKKTNVLEKVFPKKKKRNNKSKKRNQADGRFHLDVLDILIIIVITSILSCVFTGLVMNYQFKKTSFLYDKKLIADENVNDFLTTYSEIINNYYEEVDEKAMMQAAISGMLDFLEDNYSIFLDKAKTDSLSESLDGSYEGIGIISVQNVIYNVYKNSPAEKAGLKENDEIIKVNGTDINKNNFDIISELIEASEDAIEIVVKRENEELTFLVEKATIMVPATATDIIKSKGENIGYISLSSFSLLAYDEFLDNLTKMENDDHISSLIIDLRNNTGGYLNTAYNIASLFLEKNKVVYSLESKNKITTYKDETDEKRDYKIVVLVNSATASAAEILTAALHDSYGATIVGDVTFGKGKVQTMMYYEDTMMKYTSAKWLRPNGECIDEIGITPDYQVDIEITNNTVYDKQLDKAISLLS